MNAPEIGTKFDGRFTLVRSLGRGALAMTYEAVDAVNGSTVAIKLYQKDRLRAPLEDYVRYIGTLAAALGHQLRQNVILP